MLVIKIYKIFYYWSILISYSLHTIHTEKVQTMFIGMFDKTGFDLTEISPDFTENKA